MNSPNKILIFDDSCVLCNAAVKFIFKYLKKNEYYFTHFNSDFFNTNLKEKYQIKNINSVALIVDNLIYYKSDAAFLIAKDLKTPFRFLYYFKFIPKFMRDFIYDIIAKTRYKIFGNTNSCKFNPDLSKRIL